MVGLAPTETGQDGSRPGHLAMRLRNDPLELPRLAVAVEGFAARNALPGDTAAKLNLALDELLTNVMRYGFAGADSAPPGGAPAAQEIDVSLELAGDRVVAEIRDSGRPFNPLQVPEPDLEAPLESRPVGGLGVHLARQLMDVIRYRRSEGRNCLTLVKLLNGAAAP